jgi:Ser/Thr protein kinase RdoA (MazF antagonist)
VEELPLPGNVAGAVRVGNTVRRPAGPWSLSVDALLRHLELRGFEGSPRSLGFDERGRHVVEWVEGEMLTVTPTSPASTCRRVGELIRAFHDAVADFRPATGAEWNVVIPPDRVELVIHHDLAPWNLVCGSGRWAFIDWDNAGPGSRLWDISYAAHGFVPLQPGTDLSEAGRRLCALADGYGMDRADRQRLAQLLVRRITSMYDLLAWGHDSGEQPWARLWTEGHGSQWAADAAFTESNLAALTHQMLEA